MNNTNTSVHNAEKQRRELALNDWAKAQLKTMDVPVDEHFAIVSASDDASFRRYFRAVIGAQCYIFVDAPPDKEDNQSFVKIAGMLSAAGLRAPVVYKHDFQLGFLMLSDLGQELMLDKLKLASLDEQKTLYQDAIKVLIDLKQVPVEDLPAYDGARLNEEMSLFRDWFLTRYLDYSLSNTESDMLERLFAQLIDSARAQPQVFVHRDFHARNLMSAQGISLIDFQDAVAGPLTYDLVSLLKDCYWRLPLEAIESLAKSFYQQCQPEEKTGGTASEASFLRSFHLMGLQRHLKCAGIFCRLNLRDGKPGYMSDIPLVLEYMREVSNLYPELSEFGDWLGREIQPLFVQKMAHES